MSDQEPGESTSKETALHFTGCLHIESECDDAKEIEPVAADKIALDGFRMLLQWPLLAPEPKRDNVLDTNRLAKAGWVREEDPLHVLAPHRPPQPQKNDSPEMHTAKILSQSAGYAEHVYFHDFTQEFLHERAGPAGGSPAEMTLWRKAKQRAERLEVDLPGNGTIAFQIARHSLQFFKTTGVAILSVELVWDGSPETMMLATAQTAIDHVRRSYVPYWAVNRKQPLPEETHQALGLDPTGFGVRPGRVPAAVRLIGEGDPGTCLNAGNTEFWDGPAAEDARQHKAKTATPEQNRAFHQRQSAARRAAFEELSAAMQTFEDSREPDLFDHWKILASPLLDGPDPWRDPSDERIPLLSYISLASPADGKEHSNRDILRQISQADWYRLLDAEEAGSTMPYNPDFMAKTAPKGVYDRFFPHNEMASYVAARQLFGGAHYALVGAGDFHRNEALEHFRRHYAQLALITRLEYASLLALSWRMTAMVRAFDNASDKDKVRTTFDRDLRVLQQDFLSFTHQFRFTGVSSQIQPSEMFQKFRDSLDLDTLYDDVNAEIASATEFSIARRGEIEAEAATRLAHLATLGVPAGLALAGFAVKLPHHDVWPTEMQELTRLGLLVAGFYALILIANWVLNPAGCWKGREGRTNLMLALIFVLGLCMASFGSGLPTDDLAPDAPPEQRAPAEPR